jgi:uncharacterized protein (UPF0332 family)
MEAAQELLEEARLIAGIGIWTQAGRGAYSAALQAARGYIFEGTGRLVKTHSGTRAKFAELTINDARFPPDVRGFLGRSYPLKNAVDYETGPKRHVSAEDATSALAMAARFVAQIAAILAEPPPP